MFKAERLLKMLTYVIFHGSYDWLTLIYLNTWYFPVTSKYLVSCKASFRPALFFLCNKYLGFLKEKIPHRLIYFFRRVELEGQPAPASSAIMSDGSRTGWPPSASPQSCRPPKLAVPSHKHGGFLCPDHRRPGTCCLPPSPVCVHKFPIDSVAAMDGGLSYVIRRYSAVAAAASRSLTSFFRSLGHPQARLGS
jgi:hypothetical protein